MWGPRGRGAPKVVVAPCAVVAKCWVPLVCSKCQKFLNILQKIILHFQGIWRTFIFRVFLYCTDKSENRKNILFVLYFN